MQKWAVFHLISKHFDIFNITKWTKSSPWIMRHTSRTKSPNEKICCTYDSADYDDKWGESVIQI